MHQKITIIFLQNPLHISEKSSTFVAIFEKCSTMETKEVKQEPKKVSKFWEACQKLKGNIEVYDPMLLV